MKLHFLPRLLLIIALTGFISAPGTAAARSRRSSVSGDPGGHTNRGVKYARKKEYDKAIVEFSAAIESQPQDPKNYSNRALSYELSGKLEEAKADYTKAIALRPSSDDYTHRARVELRQKNLPAALKDLDKALEVNPKDIGTRRLRAYTNLQKRDWNKAIADYDEIIKGAKKTDVAALERRGFAYRSMKKYDLAAADFSAMIKAQPKDIEGYRRRAYVYRAMKDNEKAMADLRMILKLKPDDADAKALLASMERSAATPAPAKKPATPTARVKASPKPSAKIKPAPPAPVPQ
ncbi:MAG: tetratricopeptide repeat protein [Chthoniobacterales bacterium]